ncbi:MAG: hypothetical protein AB7V58_00785 [Solirubrobacterales bacterium]
MRTRAINGHRAQSASLIALGAFAVHQLRYLFAYGANSHDTLVQQGHGYLAHAIPLLVGLGLAALTARLVRSVISGPAPGAEQGIKATSYALGIAAVFCCQELIEGVLFAGHATGLAAIFTAGGWAALPLAAIFGVLAALIDRGMEAIESVVAPTPPQEDRAPLQVRLPDPPARLGRRLSPLALGLAQRPPPALT